MDVNNQGLFKSTIYLGDFRKDGPENLCVSQFAFQQLPCYAYLNAFHSFSMLWHGENNFEDISNLEMVFDTLDHRVWSLNLQEYGAKEL